MLKVLKEIECENAVETLEFKGQKVWPYLRIYIAAKLLHNRDSKSINVLVLKSFLISFFYGFSNLFKSYNYFYITSNDQRKKTGNIYTDKGIDAISSILKKGLVFELPIVKHFNKKDTPTENVVSKFILYFLVLLYSKLFVRKFKLENKDVLEKLLIDNHLTLNFKEIIIRNWSQYKVMQFLLKIYKPKAAFITCYYTNMGFIKAFKEKNIKVIEIQHGVINKSHEAYNVFKDIDSSFYPDYLLSFGFKEKETFVSDNYCIKPENVYPVGHFYLDYIVNNYQPNKRLEDISSDFKKTIAITSQNHLVEFKLIDFVIKSANLDKDILFIFIPRTLGKTQEQYGFPNNVIIVDWLNCYEIMSQSDFHSTVFSSCAIESPSIGVQNIMINIDNLSVTHFGEVLLDEKITRFINTPESFIETINNFEKLTRKEIVNSNKYIIMPDYLESLSNTLNSILSN